MPATGNQLPTEGVASEIVTPSTISTMTSDNSALAIANLAMLVSSMPKLLKMRSATGNAVTDRHKVTTSPGINASPISHANVPATAVGIANPTNRAKELLPRNTSSTWCMRISSPAAATTNSTDKSETAANVGPACIQFSTEGPSRMPANM